MNINEQNLKELNQEHEVLLKKWQDAAESVCPHKPGDIVYCAGSWGSTKVGYVVGYYARPENAHEGAEFGYQVNVSHTAEDRGGYYNPDRVFATKEEAIAKAEAIKKEDDEEGFDPFSC